MVAARVWVCHELFSRLFARACGCATSSHVPLPCHSHAHMLYPESLRLVCAGGRGQPERLAWRLASCVSFSLAIRHWAICPLCHELTCATPVPLTCRIRRMSSLTGPTKTPCVAVGLLRVFFACDETLGDLSIDGPCSAGVLNPEARTAYKLASIRRMSSLTSVLYPEAFARL